MVTIEDARILAKQIKQRSPAVLAIELFGSVLKNGRGHDVDLLLIVDEPLWKEFWSVTDDLNVKWPPKIMWLRQLIKDFVPFLDYVFIWKRKQTRCLRAARLIGLDIKALGEQYRPGTVIDVWLMPSNWRTNIAALTANKNMTIFLQNAASVAVKLE